MIDQPIAENQYFKVQGGPVIPSLVALRAYLRTISQKQYDAHVSAKKNDFATWVTEVYKEPALGSKLAACASREQMVWQLDDSFAELRMAKVLKDQDAPKLQKQEVSGQPEYSDAVALEEDAIFTGNTGEMVKRNEQISSKYEEIARSMQQALQDPIPKDIEQLVEKLRNRYNDLRAKVTETRKSGKDCLIPSLVLRQFNAKLSLALVTRSLKDFEFVKLVLDEADSELKQVIEEKEMNLKKEVMALAGLPEKPKT
jgi:hypothetical protein